ncbi:MAG: Nif3-like dinuclear metal center hexameric protein [Prevotellaceae bacterium]|jgi:dinuclear metal center YbgI/SA1388 family protein|nr:Nif3-like dinuclear metal center hexameric protein [Prevotellaceae bacterium]
MILKVKNIISELEKLAPKYFQDSYDNAGLIVGSPEIQTSSAVLCFDVTEDVVNEAIERGSGLIVSHHPVIFEGLKKINGTGATERIIIKAIQNNIAIYASHTNLDSVRGGINTVLAEKLGLSDIKILVPKEKILYKIVTFVPPSHAEKLRTAMFDAGAGHIGNYDSCSYSIEGTGTFRGGENTNPFIGKKNVINSEHEIKIETVAIKENLKEIIAALIRSHPYEEPAYDVYLLENKMENAGIGAVGILPCEMEAVEFLSVIREKLSAKIIRHNALYKKVKNVAVCGGSGAGFINEAIAANADIFVTGDCKYHHFLEFTNRIILADVGHYESESFASEIFCNVIRKNFPNFAVYLSQGNLNPVQYF